MMNRLLSLISKPGKVTGVEITYLSNQQVKAFLCQLEVKNGLVHVLNKQEIETSTDSLLGLMPVNEPLALVLNGKGILHKKLTATGMQEANTIELLQQAVPNADSKDFWIQKYIFKDGAFVSLVRKEQVKNLLDGLLPRGSWPVSLSLGVFEFSYLIDFLESEYQTGELVFETHNVTIKNREITDYKSVQSIERKQYKIGDDMLEECYLLSFSAALNTLVIKGNNPQLEIPAIAEVCDEWREKKLFTHTGIAVLGVFLIAMLLNFFLYTSLMSENALLSSRAGTAKQHLSKVSELQKEATEKNTYLTTAGWLGVTSNSFYADKLAATVPGAIHLTELNIFPHDITRSKLEKRIVLSTNIVLVKGTCNDPELLNKWINELGALNWVELVKNQNYKYDYNNSIGYFDFQLVVK
jgi:Tfp pilus assembly protein PilN